MTQSSQNFNNSVIIGQILRIKFIIYNIIIAEAIIES